MADVGNGRFSGHAFDVTSTTRWVPFHIRCHGHCRPHFIVVSPEATVADKELIRPRESDGQRRKIIDSALVYDDIHVNIDGVTRQNVNRSVGGWERCCGCPHAGRNLFFPRCEVAPVTTSRSAIFDLSRNRNGKKD